MNWTFKPILITMIYLILLSKMNCFGFSSPTQWWTVNRTANSIQVDSAKNSIIFTLTESLDTTEDIPDNSSSSPGITTTLYPTRTTTSELSHLKPVTTTDVFKKTEGKILNIPKEKTKKDNQLDTATTQLPTTPSTELYATTEQSERNTTLETTTKQLETTQNIATIEQIKTTANMVLNTVTEKSTTARWAAPTDIALETTTDRLQGMAGSTVDTAKEQPKQHTTLDSTPMESRTTGKALYTTTRVSQAFGHDTQDTTNNLQKRKNNRQYCVTLSNGTERCYEKCTGEGQFRCQNDGVCVLDEKKNQMCRCPESSTYTGPHCDVHKTPSPEDRPCGERRYFIILIVACVIIAILIITTIAIFIYFRRRHRRYSKNRDNLQFDLTSSDIRNSAGSARDTDSGFGGHTNNIYFEAMDRTSQTAQGEPGAEETESSSTYSASIQHNIYASIAEDNVSVTGA